MTTYTITLVNKKDLRKALEGYNVLCFPLEVEANSAEEARVKAKGYRGMTVYKVNGEVPW